MKVINVNDNDFEEIVLQSDKPVLVTFVADWCGPCRPVIAVMEELANEYEEKLVVVQVDVDHEPSLTRKSNIRNIPTILLFKEGERIERHIGQATKSFYKTKFKLDDKES